MTDINKQKFLAELGRLLTFMSEEDRIEALTLYEKMFDDAGDEQALMSAMQSPTRQAVVIARAYDAGSRRQSPDAEDAVGAHEPVPDFVRAILKVYEDCVPLSAALRPAPAPAERVSAPVPAPVQEAEPEEEPEAPAVIQNQVSLFDLPAEPEAPAGDREPEEKPAREEEQEPPAEPDKVDDFLADFSIQNDPLDPEPEEKDEEEPRDELREWLNRDNQPEAIARATLRRPQDEPEDGPEETVRKTNVLLLIPYVIFAVPVTVCGVLLLLIPTLLSLLAAAAAIALGCGAMVAAFGGFAVFADILIVFGCAVVALALGLFFLWLFIWFVGGPIIWLVRAMIRLGSKWCSKEVPA